MSVIFKHNPSPEDIARHIHRLAQDSGNVKITGHARYRMRDRNITRRHVLSCLRKGRVVEGPYKDVHGCWRCTMVRAVSGKDVSAAVAISFEDEAIVVTVF
jgi:hypothetical protein